VGLLDEITEQDGHGRRARCTTHTVLSVLEGQDADDLRTAIADDAITAAAIARALNQRGIEIGQESIQRHRRGACACPR